VWHRSDLLAHVHPTHRAFPSVDSGIHAAFVTITVAGRRKTCTSFPEIDALAELFLFGFWYETLNFPAKKNPWNLRPKDYTLIQSPFILLGKTVYLVPFSHCGHQAGVLAPVPPTLHPFPVSQWLMVDFVPVTAAGPLPISTGFPFKLSRLTAYEIVQPF